MTDSLPDGFRVTRLPPRGPKSGQSTESFLRGKAQGDRKWQRIKDKNISRLLQRRPFNKQDEQPTKKTP